ncbi:MAG: glycosyltransferase [Cyclobacteriaceae bacterium]|nr:glycosyltransferase [Cyclobacteriaceae bacterium HetDA_MAG_MS6]
MKYVFIIQGEGRGHMTQAISLAQILRSAGHEVPKVIVGKNAQREIPSFFYDKIGAEVVTLESPSFVTDKDHKSVKPFRTIIQSILRSPIYQKSIRAIHKIVEEIEPHVILNFYDFLGGLYHFTYRPKARFICIAHQYLLGHPEFEFPEGRKVDQATLKIGNKITALGAEKLLCLSFRHLEDQPQKKIFVVPPLLRLEVLDQRPVSGDYILIYMVNPGYGKEVERFHAANPSIKLVCFWDRKDKPDPWQVDDTLIFHQLNDHLFIEKMSGCKGYVTTAGFESVCEAMYLDKPVMMVPVAGHYEQACNAVDAVKSGAGTAHHEFNISVLSDYLPNHRSVADEFQQWMTGYKEVFLSHLT